MTVSTYFVRCLPACYLKREPCSYSEVWCLAWYTVKQGFECAVLLQSLLHAAAVLSVCESNLLIVPKERNILFGLCNNNNAIGMDRKPKIGFDSVLQTELSNDLTSVQTVFKQKLCAIRNSN